MRPLPVAGLLLHRERSHTVCVCPSRRVSGRSGVVLEELAEQLAYLELRGHECLNARRCRSIQSMDDRYLYAGLIRLHVLHHAVKEPVYGLAMIEELGRHGY